MAGYYRNFCLNFSKIAASLTNLLSKKVKFVWTDDSQLPFDKVKLLLHKSPVLKSPDYEKPFKLIIDSTDVGTGAVLVQEASDGLDHPVRYFSKKFLNYKPYNLNLSLWICAFTTMKMDDQLRTIYQFYEVVMIYVI